ncbi:heterogeneous nuclear ribonucleoprotein q [Phtheirospermum japonicum]|uniref:Heterogeneous nuclear ribonucleoprotein q n=1 Tax=Phtheirospermum japonicum TaxID=374723 RepID=A0A830BT40_9LAMI|nr:heterogeneous nuclear ribonucleoprotein q [Phtheirospermum japonicum]
MSNGDSRERECRLNPPPPPPPGGGAGPFQPQLEIHPNSNPTTPINSPPPPPPPPQQRDRRHSPPSTAPRRKSRPICTPIADNTLQKPPHTTVPASRTQPQSSQKTLVSNSTIVKSDLENIDGNNNEKSEKSIESYNPGIEQFGPGNIETVSAVGSGDGKKNTANLGSHLESEGSVKPVTGPESGPDGVTGLGNGKKKKIVKKVVRVVKKVIKRRVPKRALIHDSESQGLLVQAEESEVTKISSCDDNEIEKSNSADEVINNSSIVNEANEIPNIADDITENSNIANDELTEKTSIINEIMEKENFTDEQNSELVNNTGVSEPIISERGEDASEIDSPEQIVPANIKSNDVIACVPDSTEVEKVNYIAENVMETNESTPGKNPKSGSVEGESDCIKLNEGLILSGELEALERKRRRKTEIFVGGLNSNAKEDDIRKVFEGVGVVLEVRLVMSGGSTGRNRGFAFVRFATAGDAKNALAKCSNVKICGKQCNLALVGGNDTIFLGNLDKNWKTKHVESLLEKAGIEKIDKVTLKSDPNNVEKNRGFGFIEFETSRDAQFALNKLQKRDAFGKIPTVKVAWAQPITEPDEDEILKVKSVYAEYIPSSWDEEKVKEYFKRFGEIENVVLAKDRLSSRRKDIAFIHYTNRDDALRCIEVVSKERSEDHSSQVKIAASLANQNPKIKPMKHTADRTSQQLPKAKPETIGTSIKLHEPRHEWKPASSSYNEVKDNNNRPSTTTDELVQLLRQQAANKSIPPHPHPHPHPRTGTNALDLHFPFPGSKRPFSQVGYDPLYVEPRGLPRTRIESAYPISGSSSSSRGVDVLPFPYHPQQRPAFTSEPVIGRISYPSHFQTEESFGAKSESSLVFCSA